MMATTEQMIKANESEKLQLESDLEASEENSFQLLEEIEELESLEVHATEFLKNIPSSIKEVSEVVKELTNKSKCEIKNHEERLSDLFDSTNPNLLNAFKNLQKEFQSQWQLSQKIGVVRVKHSLIMSYQESSTVTQTLVFVRSADDYLLVLMLNTKLL